jgi:hypothetical protein
MAQLLTNVTQSVDDLSTERHAQLVVFTITQGDNEDIIPPVDIE